MRDWNEIRRDIGNRIEQLRTEKGLTQAELAAAMTTALGRNISRETVKQWERGERDLKTEYTVALADFFDTNCDFLLRGIHTQNTSFNAAFGLSDRSITNLRKLNAIPTFRELALPGFDRLVSHDDFMMFVGNLTAAFRWRDTSPSEQLVEFASVATDSPSFTAEEKASLDSFAKDGQHHLDMKDLFEYKTQQTLVSIIRNSKQEE